MFIHQNKIIGCKDSDIAVYHQISEALFLPFTTKYISSKKTLSTICSYLTICKSSGCLVPHAICENKRKSLGDIDIYIVYCTCKPRRRRGDYEILWCSPYY